MPKPKRVRKLLNQPQLQNQTDVRSFLRTTITLRQQIKNYAKISLPLTRLTRKRDQQQDYQEQKAFERVRKRATKAVELYGQDLSESVEIEIFYDASRKYVGCFIRQLQNGKQVPIMYNSFTFSLNEQNYDIYKRELKAIVMFATKYAYILSKLKPSTI